jgi:hypothetical protein
MSYQDVLQQYFNTGSLLYVLDGYGNVVFGIPSASIGDTIITSNMTSSMTVLSASYSEIIEITRVSSSFASSSISSSYSQISETSYYADIASAALSSSHSDFSDTSSYIDPSSVPHNDLQGLQGGDIGEYYHLNSSSFVQVSSGTSSYSNYSLTASYAINSSGGFIIESGSTYNITASRSETSSYVDSAVINHNGLFNLQGGAVNEYYHLTAEEYALLSAGSSSYASTSSLAYQSLSSSLAQLAISSSFASTSSFALNAGSSGTTLQTGSFYPITSSVSLESLSASIAALSISSSFANTASFALNAGGGSGGTSLTTGSLYPITASQAITSDTASYFSGSISDAINSVYSQTASYSYTASVALSVANSGISLPRYDYSLVDYGGPLAQVSSASYFIGSYPAGSLVATITSIYSGSLFIGVSKSLA